jgi:signal transduction histidine kinase
MEDAARKGTRDDDRRNSQARREDERRLRAIIDQVADGIVIVDRDGFIRFLNSAAETLFGRSAETLLGSEFGFPVTAGDSTEIEVLRPRAEAVVAELRTVEIDWDEEPALLLSLRDITDRRRAEQQARDLAREHAARAAAEAAEARYRRLADEKAALAEENAFLLHRAREASRVKSEFLAVVSHELRTPLNAIIGYIDLMQMEISGPVSETQHRQLERVRASSRHLLEMVDDILTFSRLEAGREDVRIEAVEYGQLTHDAAALVQPLADQKGLDVRVRTPAQPCSGETDGRKVRQILLNLLSNAVKFTEQGSVSVESETHGDDIVFHVRDTGIGIPTAHLEEIWDAFSQVEESHTRRIGGTGLGLSVVRRLSRLLGGEASVTSTPGEGSTFTVRLPRRAQPVSSGDDDPSPRG